MGIFKKKRQIQPMEQPVMPVFPDIPENDIDAVVTGVREVIERRVNALGVSEPIIYESEVAGERHIVVELAGIKDISSKVLGSTNKTGNVYTTLEALKNLRRKNDSA